MECVNCTACIDACDEIMEKVNKPKGLIRYSSLVQMVEHGKKSFWSFRTVLYLFLIICSLSVLVFKIATRENLHMELLRVKGPPYRVLQGAEQGFIMNQFNAHVRNQSNKSMRVKFKVVSDDPVNAVELIQQSKEIHLEAGGIQSHLLFVKAPLALTAGMGQKLLKLRVEYEYIEDGNEAEHSTVDSGIIESEMKLLAPFK
jgi:polyferredoxin